MAEDTGGEWKGPLERARALIAVERRRALGLAAAEEEREMREALGLPVRRESDLKRPHSAPHPGGYQHAKVSEKARVREHLKGQRLSDDA